MLKKVIIILLMSIGLGILLFLKPWKEEEIKDPRIIDRLPSADFIGTMNPLQLVKELSGLITYNKVKYRQFITYDFLLSQSRNLGINLQNPVYLFGYENGNWGCIIELNDNSKIENGLTQLESIFKMKKKKINEYSFLFIKDANLSVYHDKDYLLLYSGNNFSQILTEVSNSKYESVKSEWTSFLSDETFKNESLVIYSNWNKFKKYGIEKALFSHDNDTVNINLKTYIKKISPFYLSLKSGNSISNENKRQGNYLNLHLNIDEFKMHQEDILYKEINQILKRYGFPFNEFLRCWKGDLSFKEGGNITAIEKYKETELDEEFNPILVERERVINVPSYSILLSINKNFNRFYSKLLSKGFIKTENDKIRFLISPPLSQKQTKNQYILFSGTRPKVEENFQNEMHWLHKGIRYNFYLDKIVNDELYGKLILNVKNISNQPIKILKQ